MLSSDDLAALRAQLVKFEGLKLKPYIDTVGVITIGVGRNLRDKGISKDEAFYLRDNDISEATDDLYRAFPWVQTLDPIRQRALIDMTFNMGITELLAFHHLWTALFEAQYAAAAAAMIDSKWAKEVGYRATTLAAMMRTGTIPAGTLLA